MTELALRTAHPAEPKEITPWGVWVAYRVVLGMVFVLNFAPFVIYYIQH